MQTLRAEQDRRRELQAALAGLPLVSHAAQGSHYAHCLQYWARKNKSDPQVTSRKAVQRPGEVSSQSGRDSRTMAGRRADSLCFVLRQLTANVRLWGKGTLSAVLRQRLAEMALSLPLAARLWESDGGSCLFIFFHWAWPDLGPRDSESMLENQLLAFLGIRKCPIAKACLPSNLLSSKKDKGREGPPSWRQPEGEINSGTGQSQWETGEGEAESCHST